MVGWRWDPPKNGKQMSETREVLLKHYREIWDDLRVAIDGLSDEQLSDPSLDGWSVKDHLAHMALWDDVRASEIARISAGHDSVWRMAEGEDDIYNALSYELRRSMTAVQVRWEVETSRQKVLDVIATATPRGLDGSLYGEAGLRSSHAAAHAGWIKRWRGEQGI